ncbi:unnamed protein product [Arctogadus glacialis]
MAEHESLEFGKADFVLMDNVCLEDFMANLKLRPLQYDHGVLAPLEASTRTLTPEPGIASEGEEEDLGQEVSNNTEPARWLPFPSAFPRL